MKLFLFLAFVVWLEGAIITCVRFVWPLTKEGREREYERYLDMRWGYGCTRGEYLFVALLICCFWPVLVSFRKEQ